MTTTHSTNNVTSLFTKPVVISDDDHNITRSQINENALKVLYRLKNAGYKAYLVGGCIRDLLIGIQPKDFDVVTDARPEQIRELFRNCRLIGRRFRLAHVRYGQEIIEVSTFRAPHHSAAGEGHTEEGRIVRDNVYGDIDDDVWRRDFTINALFFNIEDHSITDYVNALSDINTRQIRLIGEPDDRYKEDPVRMLRAIRFAAKLDFELHPSTEKPISELKDLLNRIPTARLFEEFLKLFMSGHALMSYKKLLQYGLFEYLCPQADHILKEQNYYMVDNLLSQAFSNTDLRISEGKPVTPAFLLAAILWIPIVRLKDEHISNGLTEMDATQLASDTVISRQVKSLAVPRRYSRIAREIWELQNRMKHIHGKKPYRLLSHPRFRAAYDFLALRAKAGENIEELVDWWTVFQEQNFEQYGYHTRDLHRPFARKKRKKRRDRY